MIGEFVHGDGKVADEADDKWIVGGEVEYPLVVFDPWTGFDDDCAGDGMRDRERAVVFGKDGAIKKFVVARRPWDALRARGIVEVRMRIDDARRADGIVGCARSTGKGRSGNGE